MRLLWNFIGRAAEFTDRIWVVHSTEFELGPEGLPTSPINGDLVRFAILGSKDLVWFKCVGRRFDFESEDDPVLQIDLDLQ